MDKHDLHVTADFLEEQGWTAEVIALLREIANYEKPEVGALVRISPLEWEEQYAKPWHIEKQWLARTPFGIAEVRVDWHGGFRWYWPGCPDHCEGELCDSIEECMERAEEWFVHHITDGIECPLFKYLPKAEIPF